MFISVIIPTFNDWERLIVCLKALESQSLGKSQFEVIVANNNPSYPIPEISLSINTKIIDVSKAGSYAARNAALSLAKGEIIAFTDSDCIPDVNWLGSAVKIFSEQTETERIAGKINLTFQGSKKSPVECYEAIYAFDQKDNVRKGLAVTANFFSRSRLFSSLGKFDDSLLSGGDYQWNRIAQQAGSKIIYSEEAMVSHPARHTFDQLRKKAKRVAAGQFGTALKKAPFLPSLLTLIYELRPPVFEIKKIFTVTQLSVLEKIQVWWIRYWFRSLKALEQFNIRLSGKKPTNN